MTITNEEKKILEQRFGVYENENNYELESWTDRGVNMFINIDKNSNENLLEQLETFVDNFNLDEEIDYHREDVDYKLNFTIKESIEDFESWLNYLLYLIEELKKLESKKDIKVLKGVGVTESSNGLAIVLIDIHDNIMAQYDIQVNIMSYSRNELFQISYEISKEINELYYTLNEVPTEEQVKDIVRKIIIK